MLNSNNEKDSMENAMEAMEPKRALYEGEIKIILSHFSYSTYFLFSGKVSPKIISIQNPLNMNRTEKVDEMIVRNHNHNHEAHHFDHDHKYDDEIMGKERKLSGKFSGLEKMRKSRKNNDSKSEERAFLFNLI